MQRSVEGCASSEVQNHLQAWFPELLTVALLHPPSRSPEARPHNTAQVVPGAPPPCAWAVPLIAASGTGAARPCQAPGGAVRVVVQDGGGGTYRPVLQLRIQIWTGGMRALLLLLYFLRGQQYKCRGESCERHRSVDIVHWTMCQLIGVLFSAPAVPAG